MIDAHTLKIRVRCMRMMNEHDAKEATEICHAIDVMDRELAAARKVIAAVNCADSEHYHHDISEAMREYDASTTKTDAEGREAES